MARGKAIAALVVIGLFLWKGRGVMAGKELLGDPMPTGPSPEAHQVTLDRAATLIAGAPVPSEPIALTIGVRTEVTWVVPENIREAAAISGMSVEQWLAEQGA